MSVPTDPAGSAQVLDTHVLTRTAEHLADRQAGVFSPDLVERMVFESHATLARTVRVHPHLAPLAGHFAADRLAALAHTRGTTTGGLRDTGLPQVLFVDAEDTGRTQIAAALLTHYAHGMVVARSAGFSTGEAVDPRVVDVLVARGVDTRVRALYEQIRVHPPARLRR